MGKLAQLTAKEAESLLLKAGFELVRSKGSHRIYRRQDTRIVIPFHSGRILHPKIVKQIFETLEKIINKNFG